MKKQGLCRSSTEILHAFRTLDYPTISTIIHTEEDDDVHFTVSFQSNTEHDIVNAEPAFWLIFKLMVDTGKSPPNEKEPPTLKRLRQTRLDCRGVVLALLHVASRRIDLRRWIPRDIWRVIAEMVWSCRWEEEENGNSYG